MVLVTGPTVTRELAISSLVVAFTIVGSDCAHRGVARLSSPGWPTVYQDTAVYLDINWAGLRLTFIDVLPVNVPPQLNYPSLEEDQDAHGLMNLCSVPKIVLLPAKLNLL